MKRIILDVIVDGIYYNPAASEPNILLTAFLWLICLTAAGIFLYSETRKKQVLSLFLKGSASLCFVLLGILGYEISDNYAAAQCVLMGLLFGLAGDVLLVLRSVLPKTGQVLFLAGILAFLAGHVMYIIALAPLCDCLAASVITAAVLAAVLCRWIFQKITVSHLLRILGVLYLSVIMIMTCIALGILFTDFSVFSGLFSAGALLFLVSDIILILNWFGPESKESFRISNIILYYTGQLLIAASLQFI